MWRGQAGFASGMSQAGECYFVLLRVVQVGLKACQVEERGNFLACMVMCLTVPVVIAMSSAKAGGPADWSLVENV